MSSDQFNIGHDRSHDPVLRFMSIDECNTVVVLVMNHDRSHGPFMNID